ncbi:MAG: KEOPS complex subunit Pcc1 [Candidatus ainarchaeum sp.]|nr:KEOPS complex subunit Pcc1 [Candidatus ainarchaeum sp.]
MKNSAELIIDVPEKEAESIIAALKKEDASNKRFSSTISMRAGKLVIKVEAEDMVALRSTLNSYLRYLQTIEEFGQKFPEV